MSTKILVCCHKKDVMATQQQFMPIHVGKALHKDVELNIQPDNTGDNISKKNNSYCELTGMYWAWKNLSGEGVKIIGLNHYRRYFDFHHQVSDIYNAKSFSSRDFRSLDLSVPSAIEEEINNGAVVSANPIYFDASLAYTYCYYHNSKDFKALQHVIASTQPEYIRKAFWEVMYQNCKLMPYNMFLMSWDDFDNYCIWLFDILQRVENIIDISDYDFIQRRIYGYMGERLLNVWLRAERKKIISKPIIWVNDSPSSSLPKFKQLLTKLKYELAYQLLKNRSYTGLEDKWTGTANH